MKLNIIDEILLHIFKKYSKKVYKIGLQNGFNWKK